MESRIAVETTVKVERDKFKRPVLILPPEIRMGHISYLPYKLYPANVDLGIDFLAAYEPDCSDEVYLASVRIVVRYVDVYV